MKVKLLSHVRLLATPWTAAYQAPPSMGFSRQEYWSGVLLPSLVKVLVRPNLSVHHHTRNRTKTNTSRNSFITVSAAAAAAKSLQSCPTLCDPIDAQPTRLPHPWDSPGKNTGVGCHFLLQCMKMKSESEGAQSCLTLSDPMDCSLPGSSICGIFQARVLEWGAIAFCRFERQDMIILTHLSKVISGGLSLHY